jgi:enoyl-CoA hydratase/carnithine racemase
VGGVKLVRIAYHDALAILELNRGVTNALNLQLVIELTEALQKVKQSEGMHGVVLRSSNEKFFSIGFDIPELFQLPRDDFHVFYHSFNQLCVRLYTFPKPTIAAITGHAVAGGCILALCCDYRLIAQGRKLMGMNEIKLGVPVPYPADCILRQVVGPRHAREIVYGGEFYESEKSLQLNMVDEVLPLHQVVQESIRRASSLSELFGKAFEMIKRNRTEAVEAQILSNIDEKERFFIECWYSPDTRERLTEAIQKYQQ